MLHGLEKFLLQENEPSRGTWPGVKLSSQTSLFCPAFHQFESRYGLLVVIIADIFYLCHIFYDRIDRGKNCSQTISLSGELPCTDLFMFCLSWVVFWCILLSLRLLPSAHLWIFEFDSQRPAKENATCDLEHYN